MLTLCQQIQANPQTTADSPVQCETVRTVNRQTVRFSVFEAQFTLRGRNLKTEVSL